MPVTESFKLFAQGLAIFGIDKPSLHSAGLTIEAIGQLHRALYVYTIGFQDKVRKLLGPIEHKQVPLNNIWRAYLAIAETAMKVGFKVCLVMPTSQAVQFDDLETRQDEAEPCSKILHDCFKIRYEQLSNCMWEAHVFT